MMDAETIAAIVRHITEAWRAGRYDEIGPHLSDDVVLAPPGSATRIVGRDAYVQSFRDYDRVAITDTFTPDAPQIDVMGDVAVATCPFFVVYRLDGVTHSERGRELLVFARQEGDWRIVWRSMISEPAA